MMIGGYELRTRMAGMPSRYQWVPLSHCDYKVEGAASVNLGNELERADVQLTVPRYAQVMGFANLAWLWHVDDQLKTIQRVPWL